MAAQGAEAGAAAWPAPPSFPQREPPAPVEGDFSMFGVIRTMAPPEAPRLEEQVYDESADRCEELRSLNRAMLQRFLQLVQLMHDSPSRCLDKGAPRHAQHTCAPFARSLARRPTAVTELRTLFLNFQHLLNTFRPHEAREELISTVQQQTAAKRQLIAELDAACAKALEEFREEASGQAIEPEAEEPMDVVEPAAPAQPPLPQDTRDPDASPPRNDPQTLARLLQKLEAVPVGAPWG